MKKYMGVSDKVLDFVRFLGASYPKLPKIRRLDEYPTQMKELDRQLTELVFLALMPSLAGFMDRGRFRSMALRQDATGFPQGAPTSPILSIIALEHSLFKL